jgi:transposase-like protein
VRRRFTAEYKLRILREADRCTESGQLGALLRREGLYSSHLSTWRQQRDEGTLVGLTPKRRGRKANPDTPFSPPPLAPFLLLIASPKAFGPK